MRLYQISYECITRTSRGIIIFNCISHFFWDHLPGKCEVLDAGIYDNSADKNSSPYQMHCTIHPQMLHLADSVIVAADDHSIWNFVDCECVFPCHAALVAENLRTSHMVWEEVLMMGLMVLAEMECMNLLVHVRRDSLSVKGIPKI